MITKEVKLLGSNGGSVEDLQGVYDIFCYWKNESNSYHNSIRRNR